MPSRSVSVTHESSFRRRCSQFPASCRFCEQTACRQVDRYPGGGPDGVGVRQRNPRARRSHRRKRFAPFCRRSTTERCDASGMGSAVARPTPGASESRGPMNIAELLSECLIRLGVRHAFGVGGANIEDLFLAIQRRRPRLRAVLCKHEHAAGTAADAYARLTGGLGVVLVTSGGGAMNLVHAVAEAKASRVPLVALVGEPPTDQRGR